MIGAQPRGPDASLPGIVPALRLAGRQSLLAAALYVPGLLLAILGALPLWLGLLSLDATGRWAQAIATGGYAGVAIESIGALRAAELFPAAADSTPVEAAYAGFALSLFGLVFLLPLQWLAYTFVCGGVLERMTDRHGATFLMACRHWFWPMFRCGLTGGIVLALTILVLLLPFSLVTTVFGAAGGLLPVLLLVVLLLLVRGIGAGYLELVRASIVVGNDQRVFTAYRRELGRLASLAEMIPVLAVWCVLTLVEIVIVAGGGAVLAAISAVALIPAFLAGQALALALAWLKLFRLAVATEIARGDKISPLLPTYPDA